MACVELIRSLCRVSGVTSFLWKNLPPALYVFNYHRIGDPSIVDFDPDVFSCTEERFAEHVDLIRARFEVITVARLLSMIEGMVKPTHPMAMITFDDGYRDNYTKAFPVLRATGTPAVFFLTTSFVGSSSVSWWDEVVWQAKRLSAQKMATIPWLHDVISDQPRPQLYRQILRAFKRCASPIDEKLGHLRQATGKTVDPAAAAGLFMTWEEARTMRGHGMDIGSHSHTHPILSHLTKEEQHSELATSRRILQTELGEEISTVAYPVGGRLAYAAETLAAARSCGYRAAFTFVPGINQQPGQNAFELNRIGVKANPTTADFCLSTARVAARSGGARQDLAGHPVRRTLNQALAVAFSLRDKLG